MADNGIKVPIAQFIENVGSAPSEVAGKYSSLLAGTPVAINGNLWGWVNRNRLFWLAGDSVRLSAETWTRSSCQPISP